jgi:hypothetical protein
MSLGRRRRSTRFLAAMLLLATMWQLPHRSADDEVCLPASEAHDESKHVFTVETGSGHADHCAVCHWMRLLKPDLSVRTAAVHVDGAGDDLSGSGAVVHRDPASENLPPRAPPSAVTAARQPLLI